MTNTYHSNPFDLMVSWGEQAERAAWRQYDAAAECCAAQIVLGATKPRMPPVTAKTRALISDDIGAFWRRVDEHVRTIGASAMAVNWP